MKRNVVECGKGWETIYQPIIDMIIEFDNKQDNVDDKIGIGQIKEKWGALEIYPLNSSNMTPTIKEAITDAYLKSKSMCEYCGTTENVGTTMNHWSITCCQACWNDIIVPRHEDSRWKDLKSKIIYKKNTDG